MRTGNGGRGEDDDGQFHDDDSGFDFRHVVSHSTTLVQTEISCLNYYMNLKFVQISMVPSG